MACGLERKALQYIDYQKGEELALKPIASITSTQLMLHRTHEEVTPTQLS